DIHTEEEVDYSRILEDPSTEDGVDIHVKDNITENDKEKERHPRKKNVLVSKKKCYENFSREELDEIHTTYWSKEKKHTQTMGPRSCEKCQPKRRYTESTDATRKNF
ncbi:unnamed protein product, partial [Meganyctiphanes norvegica]